MARHRRNRSTTIIDKDKYGTKLSWCLWEFKCLVQHMREHPVRLGKPLQAKLSSSLEAFLLCIDLGRKSRSSKLNDRSSSTFSFGFGAHVDGYYYRLLGMVHSGYKNDVNIDLLEELQNPVPGCTRRCGFVGRALVHQGLADGRIYRTANMDWTLVVWKDTECRPKLTAVRLDEPMLQVWHAYAIFKYGDGLTNWILTPKRFHCGKSGSNKKKKIAQTRDGGGKIQMGRKNLYRVVQSKRKCRNKRLGIKGPKLIDS